MVETEMNNTLNQRASPGAIDTRAEANVLGQDNWIEVRLQGKLPERRSNHCAFILAMKDGEYLFVHGGRDLKEGPIQSMWKVNISGIQQLFQDPYYPVEWEQVAMTGRGPGSISHHTAFVMGSKEVLFYGGMKGEDSNSEIFIFNANNCSWQTIHLAEPAKKLLPRDDHCLSDCGNGSFLVFGGFVNGSRVSEVLKFMPSTVSVNGEMLSEESSGACPCVRASSSSAIYQDKLYVFGGQDDDNNKLDDLWEFDTTAKSWKQIDLPENTYRPMPRSGHTAVVHGTKMYVFGGIFELTKELNDMCVFDFTSMTFLEGEELADYFGGSPDKTKNPLGQDTFNEASPTRTNRKDASPGRRKTIGFGYGTSGASPMKSPTKKSRLNSPSKNERPNGEKQDGPGTPTSISMQNRFIIKNADSSFDQYYQSMKKRKAQHFAATDHTTTANDAKFGLIRGAKPTARDGHIAVVDSNGYMYVFGGDRHHMPFNDLYMIQLV